MFARARSWQPFFHKALLVIFCLSIQQATAAEKTTVALVCSGTFFIYKPEKSKMKLSASAATIDYEEHRFTTSIGEFGIQDKDEQTLWVVANKKTPMGANEHLSGTIDRLTGSVFLAWLDQSSKTKLEFNRRVDLVCKPASRLF